MSVDQHKIRANTSRCCNCACRCGSSKTYNINVTAPIGSDAYAIGETLTRYLDEYEGGAA